MLTELCNSIIGMNIATPELSKWTLDGFGDNFSKILLKYILFPKISSQEWRLNIYNRQIIIQQLDFKKICCPHLPNIGHHLFIMIITNSLRISKLFCERISCLQLSRVFVHLECRTQPEPEVWNDVLAFHENQGWPIDFLEKNIYHF